MRPEKPENPSIRNAAQSPGSQGLDASKPANLS
jgi:hypothetical protein